METEDNGKLLREMRAQLAAMPEYYYYYAGLADKIQGDTIPGSSRAMLNYTLREPLGVVGAITPWNSPLTLTTSKLAPALAAGNTIVIKPSEYTSATVLRLAALADEAGFPPGVVNVVTGFGAEAGAALVDDARLAKISFTGSTATGARIASSTASRFIGSTLELGGKSPNIVFADADMANASMGVVAGIFAAAGQTCIAGSRVFAHKSIYDELLERVANRARSIVIGDPLLDATELGPAGLPGPARQGGQLRRSRRLRRRHRPDRRRPAQYRPRRLLLRTHRPDRRRQFHARGPGGDLRPRRGNHAV